MDEVFGTYEENNDRMIVKLLFEDKKMLIRDIKNNDVILIIDQDSEKMTCSTKIGTYPTFSKIIFNLKFQTDENRVITIESEFLDKKHLDQIFNSNQLSLKNLSDNFIILNRKNLKIFYLLQIYSLISSYIIINIFPNYFNQVYFRINEILIINQYELILIIFTLITGLLISLSSYFVRVKTYYLYPKMIGYNFEHSELNYEQIKYLFKNLRNKYLKFVYVVTFLILFSLIITIYLFEPYIFVYFLLAGTFPIIEIGFQLKFLLYHSQQP
jgi:hypothetical protein